MVAIGGQHGFAVRLRISNSLMSCSIGTVSTISNILVCVPLLSVEIGLCIGSDGA